MPPRRSSLVSAPGLWDAQFDIARDPNKENREAQILLQRLPETRAKGPRFRGKDDTAIDIWVVITETMDLLDLCEDGSAERKERSETLNGQPRQHQAYLRPQHADFGS
jgi:hypothetical protein